MNQQLQRAIEAIEKLPDGEQTVIADRILYDLSDREWDEIVHKPRVQNRLWELAQEAMNDEAEEGGFGE
jgi:hypothetical protein